MDLGVQVAFSFFALGLLLVIVGDFSLGIVEWWRRFIGR
jgi:hypothetical protein